TTTARSSSSAIRCRCYAVPGSRPGPEYCLVMSALDTRPGEGERQAPVRACGSRARAGARERAGSAPRIPGAGAWPAATAPALAAGCGGAAHGAFLARACGKAPHSTAHGSAPWKLAAPGAAKFQRIATQPDVLEVGRTGRGEVPTQRRAALRAWKFTALSRANFLDVYGSATRAAAGRAHCGLLGHRAAPAGLPAARLGPAAAGHLPRLRPPGRTALARLQGQGPRDPRAPGLTAVVRAASRGRRVWGRRRGANADDAWRTLLPEPLPQPVHLELTLRARVLGPGPDEVHGGLRQRVERALDQRRLAAAHLEVAEPVAAEGRRRGPALHLRSDRGGGVAAVRLGEQPGFGQRRAAGKRDVDDVADGVHAGVARLERAGIHGDPVAALGQPALA